ncbi:hypothetical protein BCR34DRAFT_564091 [Clohesyomyces aquaticus]|uniref:Uncharacterized protein n=1 Tax=Clohesyomyces aquaticus TaxID=1231657 RepID=A0A1Y1ZPR5_9PLEO|nr:hypothetical protein BCR34DRAFT_564091 [Clohesyomyces aquaticus]
MMSCTAVAHWWLVPSNSTSGPNDTATSPRTSYSTPWTLYQAPLPVSTVRHGCVLRPISKSHSLCLRSRAQGTLIASSSLPLTLRSRIDKSSHPTQRTHPLPEIPEISTLVTLKQPWISLSTEQMPQDPPAATHPHRSPTRSRNLPKSKDELYHLIIKDR